MQQLEEIIDQQRWLLNNGLLTEEAKNNIYVYGALVHKDIVSVEVSINVETKTIAYTLYAEKRLLKAIEKYKYLKSKNDILALIRLKFLIKKFGNINLHQTLNKFIKDYCGPSWQVIMVLKNESEYQDGEENIKNRSVKDE